MRFEWDNANRKHIARHGIAPAATLFRGKIRMPKKQIAIPKFRTEAEEAKWWDKNPEVATHIMKTRDQIRQSATANTLEDHHDENARNGCQSRSGTHASNG